MPESMGLAATLKASFSWTATKTIQGSEGKFSEVDAQTVTLTDGTGSGQADLIYRIIDATIAYDSSPVEYDLFGSLSDLFGEAATFVRIKGLLIANTSSTEATLVVGGKVTTGIDLLSVKTTTFNIDSGGFYCMGGKVGVLVSTDNDILQIDNLDDVVDATVKYSITIIGATA